MAPERIDSLPVVVGAWINTTDAIKEPDTNGDLWVIGFFGGVLVKQRYQEAVRRCDECMGGGLELPENLTTANFDKATWCHKCNGTGKIAAEVAGAK